MLDVTNYLAKIAAYSFVITITGLGSVSFMPTDACHKSDPGVRLTSLGSAGQADASRQDEAMWLLMMV